MNEIGKSLKIARIESGLKQREVAQEIGVLTETISSWETGRYSPTIDNAIKLARVYGKSLDELFLPSNCT